MQMMPWCLETFQILIHTKIFYVAGKPLDLDPKCTRLFSVKTEHELKDNAYYVNAALSKNIQTYCSEQSTREGQLSGP